MFEAQHIMPEAKRKRLKRTWAHWIHEHLLSAIDEEPFREHYGTTERPTKPVKVLLVLLLLQHIEDLTDAQVIKHFEFNLLWHHATGVEPADTHVWASSPPPTAPWRRASATCPAASDSRAGRKAQGLIFFVGSSVESCGSMWSSDRGGEVRVDIALAGWPVRVLLAAEDQFPSRQTDAVDLVGG